MFKHNKYALGGDNIVMGKTSCKWSFYKKRGNFDKIALNVDVMNHEVIN